MAPNKEKIDFAKMSEEELAYAEKALALGKERTANLKEIVDYTQEINKLQKQSESTSYAIYKIAKDAVSHLNDEYSLKSKIEQLDKSRKDEVAKQNKLIEKQNELNQKLLLGTKLSVKQKNMLIQEIESTNNELKNSIELEQSMIDNQTVFINKLDTVLLKQKGMSIAFGEGSKSIEGMISGAEKVGDLLKAIGRGSWLAVLQIAVEIFDSIKGILFEQNQQVTELQNTLAVSGEEARRMRTEFVNIERSSSGVGSAFVTVKNQLKAATELSAVFGASVDFSGEKANALIKDQISLNKEWKLTGEEAGSMSKTLLMLGDNEKSFGLTVAKSAMDAKNRTGVTFNLKEVMVGVSKLSAATALSLSKSPKSLSDAVVKAKELGVAVDKMNGIADGLLNIESSISAQFEASVLTGKDLNFELAREKALRNDIAGAAADILAQVGTAKDFTNMNRIAQEAMAKAVGMTRDELAESLITQENFNKLGKIARDDLEKRLVGLSKEEQTKIRLSVQDDASAVAATKKIAAQEKMTQMQEKFTSIVTNLLAPLEPIVDMFATIFEIVSPLASLLTIILLPITEGLKYITDSMAAIVSYFKDGGKELTIWQAVIGGIAATYLAIKGTLLATKVIQGIMLAIDAARGIAGKKALLMENSSLVKAVGIAAFKAYASAAAVPFIGPALGAAAAVGVGVLAAKYFTSLNDGMINPKGGLVVSGEQGRYKLNENDTVIAGTDLGKKREKMGGDSGLLGGILGGIGNALFGRGVTRGDTMISEVLSTKFDTLIAATNTLTTELKNKSFNANLDLKKLVKEGNEVSQTKFAKS